MSNIYRMLTSKKVQMAKITPWQIPTTLSKKSHPAKFPIPPTLGKTLFPPPLPHDGVWKTLLYFKNKILKRTWQYWFKKKKVKMQNTGNLIWQNSMQLSDSFNCYSAIINRMWNTWKRGGKYKTYAFTLT